ncbi:hypothetical protein TRFO_41142 [Tritrichomonas foetus]|uniref:Helicase C-terminal domain-containing protein n=1 Tax=Tritrichomonas foetus TaxID=1144522 RepID=A0A1J4L1G8_9EUKA|nr:hypothetical protein TRFO_41142 [Tritrichomonas foetus]|eukprot:OHT17283.1 hypothetical protein TRFO_41142 [Tritrichomonas foetus]
MNNGELANDAQTHRKVALSSLMTNHDRISTLSTKSLQALEKLAETDQFLPKWFTPQLLSQSQKSRDPNAGSSIDRENSKTISQLYMMRHTDYGTEFLLRYNNDTSPFCFWVQENQLLTNPSFGQCLASFRENTLDFNQLSSDTDCSILVISHRKVGANIEYLYQVNTRKFSVFFWETPQNQDESLASRFYMYYLRSVPIGVDEKPAELPPFDSKGLFPYQKDGVRWLIKKYIDNKRVILADEVGLGKTAQFLSFINHVSIHSIFKGPFLIIVHSDQLYEWKQAVEDWTDLYPLIYDGSEFQCEVLRNYGFLAIDRNGITDENSLSFNILLVSYEIFNRDYEILSTYQWRISCLDNPSIIFQSKELLLNHFNAFSDNHQVLLIDNILEFSNKHLIQILNYLSPEIKWNDNLFSKNYRKRAKQLLKDYILCRTRSIVGIGLDLRKEYVAFVLPTNTQKMMFRLLQLNELYRICQPDNPHAFDWMPTDQLAQSICNHPYLVKDSESYLSAKINVEKRKRMIGVSSKFLLLDRVLTATFEKKTKVAIFTQSKKFFVLVEDFLQLSNWKYFVVNDQMEKIEKESLLQYFNSESNNDIFIVLSSINLTSIELTTVQIILLLDPDWNPQTSLATNDNLFQERIYPKKYIFRILTFGSSEHEKFVNSSIQKYIWNSLIISGTEPLDNQILDIMPPDYSILTDPPSDDIINEFYRVSQIVPANALRSIRRALQAKVNVNSISDRDFLHQIGAIAPPLGIPTTSRTHEPNKPFEEAEMPVLIDLLKKYGFGSWKKISESTSGHDSNQIFEFGCTVIILSFRSIPGCFVPESPALISQLNATVPDFTPNVLFCPENKNWGIYFNEYHMFNDTLSQMRKFRDIIEDSARPLLQILEARCIYSIWASHFGQNFFVFNKLPPKKDRATDQLLLDQFINYQDIDLNNERIQEILQTMKYDLLIEQKFEIIQFFRWWCESEFVQVLRIFKSFGYNYQDINKFHAQTGILSKSTNELKRFAAGFVKSLTTGNKIYPTIHLMQAAPDYVQKYPNFFDWANIKDYDFLEVRFVENLIQNLRFTVLHFEKLYINIPYPWTSRDLKKFLLLLLQYGIQKFDDIFHDPSFSLPEREIAGEKIAIFENVSQFSLFISRIRDTFENSLLVK